MEEALDANGDVIGHASMKLNVANGMDKVVSPRRHRMSSLKAYQLPKVSLALWFFTHKKSSTVAFATVLLFYFGGKQMNFS